MADEQVTTPETRVETTEEPKGIDKPIGRAAQIEELARRRAEALGVAAEEETEPQAPAEVPAHEEAPQETSPEAEEAPEPAEPEAPAEQLVRVKVDGEERQVPLSEVLANYQMLQAAERRLEEAKRIKREAREEALQLKQQRTPPPQPAPQPQPQEGELISAYNAALYEGDQNKANQLLSKILNARQMQARQEWARQQQMAEGVQALEKFKGEFPEIASDPVAWAAADGLSVVVQAQMQRAEAERAAEEGRPPRRIPPWEVMQETGRIFRGRFVQQAKPLNVQARQEAKRAHSGAVPKAAAQAPTPQKPEEKPMSRTDIINEMRKKRGQQPKEL